jgi:hypothetical protein
MPVGVEHVDKTIARTRHVVVFLLILLDIGDEEVPVNVLDAEGCEPPGRFGSVKPPSISVAVAGRKPADPLGANTSIVPARKWVAKRKTPCPLVPNTSPL